MNGISNNELRQNVEQFHFDDMDNSVLHEA